MITNGLAKFSYDRLGWGAIDFAESEVATVLDVALEVAVGRHYQPETWPAYGDTPTIASVAAKIVGALLAAGWEPPSGVKLTGTPAQAPVDPNAHIPLAMEYLAKCTRAMREER